MPKLDDINKVMIISSGPIVISQIPILDSYSLITIIGAAQGPNLKVGLTALRALD